jgi:GNAT superfamily N-acetyltransferase
MRAIDDHDELVALCGGDTLCRWVAQGLDGRGRAWASADGRALAVAGAGISRRDRVAVSGPAASVVPLVRDVLHEVGPAYRPLGDPPLIDAIVGGVPGLATGKAFGWMDRTAAPPQDGERPHGVRWLPDAETPEAAALLQEVSPGSDAMPGVPGVERWAGIRDDEGRLVALAALAWSAPSVGLVAGVAVRPAARGRGLGRAVCGFVVAEALRRYGCAALMVDAWNEAAIGLYRGLGMGYRPIRAAYAEQPFLT